MQAANDMVLGAYDYLMLEHAPVSIALFDAQTLRLLSANRSYQALYEPKWQHGQMIGQHVSDLLPEEDRDEIIALFHHIIQTGLPSQAQEYKTVSSAGNVRYWHWTLNPIRDKEQKQYVLAAITEVTTQAQARDFAEQAQARLIQARQMMQREQQRLEYIEAILLSMHNASDPRMLAQAILEALGACFSLQAQALYGAGTESGKFSLLAFQAYANLPDEGSLFPGSLSPQSPANLREAVEQHRSLLMKRSECDIHSAEQERIFSLLEAQSILYLPLWEKRCEGILVLALPQEEAIDDLLPNVLAECTPYIAKALASARLHADLSNEKHRLHTILDQLPEGVLLVEARTSKISYANPAAAGLLGFALPQLVGTPLNQSALLSPYGRPQKMQQAVFRWNFALIDALWGKTTSNQELVIPRQDGSEIVVLSSAAPIRRCPGLISEAVIVFQDITALKQLEQQKAAFFAVANHELRTPLTIITGFAELLQMCDPRTQETEEVKAMSAYALTSIQEECEHLLRLIHDLLDVSRLDQMHLEVQRTPQDLLTLLKQVVAKHIHTTNTHRLSLYMEDLKPDDMLIGRFDLPRIEQVVRNLITNAVKYSPNGSAIEVGVRPSRDQEGRPQEVTLWVKDQGIGIQASDLPHLFERFYRACTLDRSSSGFGIGLYLTRQLVQAHKGRINVESTPGKGSTFFVTLPLGEADQAAI